MRLKTRLTLAAAVGTLVLVLVMSLLFLAQLMRQRIEQTLNSNVVLTREVLLVTRHALETGLAATPPEDDTPEALQADVIDVLRRDAALRDVMAAILRYSAIVQDVSVTDAHGTILVSTDPDSLNQTPMERTTFQHVQDGSIAFQSRVIFGRPRVLDVSGALDRNGAPFAVVHIGVRSTFLRASFVPWLKGSALFALLAGIASVALAAVLANLALRPIETINERLERMTQRRRALAEDAGEHAELQEDAAAEQSLTTERSDAVGSVARKIDELDERMERTEQGYLALETNLNQMLDTLRDGVMLVTGAHRVAMASDAMEHFVGRPAGALIGLPIHELFPPQSALGEAVMAALHGGVRLAAEALPLEDGRLVEVSVDPIAIAGGAMPGQTGGALVTLHDTESVRQLGQELEVSRRLAAVGRLTAGVGHEVKNPINAMVVHLELLKSKLAAAPAGTEGAQRHVEILAAEMQRLDRVVQTLADFTRPVELRLQERDLRDVVRGVLELTGGELAAARVTVETEMPSTPVPVRVDAELIRQALLNVALNAAQAMPEGGPLRVSVRRQGMKGIVEVADRGYGIAPEMLPRIFDLYFTTKEKGSGIGLPMTYRVLQMHGGAVDVRSTPATANEPGETVFTLILPLAVSSKAASQETGTVSPRTPYNQAHGESQTRGQTRGQIRSGRSGGMSA
jgi:signal transduction histidine kinase